MLGQGWEEPVHRDPLVEISELAPKIEPSPQSQPEPKSQPQSSNPTLKTEENTTIPSIEITSGESTTSATSVSCEETPTTSAGSEPPKVSTISNEELAKMYQPKHRQSIAHRLKSHEFLYTSPNRYVFPGAEVFDRDDESDISSNNSGSDTDSDHEGGESSDDNNVEKNKNSSNCNGNSDQNPDLNSTIAEQKSESDKTLDANISEESAKSTTAGTC